jgi:creatinine amidohydrolase
MMRHAIHRLEALTWVEATLALTDAVAILPIGAIEAHGPHLPLNTDLLISEEVARRTAEALVAERSVVILPSIAYGVSYVGACFAGTTPAPPSSVTQLIAEVLVTTLDRGANAAIIVNSHLEPAHTAAIAEARVRTAAATRKPVAFADIRAARWSARLSQEFRDGMRHAGAYETSLILAAHPDAVHQEMLPTLQPVLVDLPTALKAGARSFEEAGGTLGYFGNPASATAEEGESMFEALVSIMVDALLEETAMREELNIHP